MCLVTIGDDFQSSLETTSLLKELGAKLVVSRASSDVHAKFLLNNGADEIVYPEKQLARWSAVRYSADHIVDYIELDEEFSIFEVTIPQEFVDHTIQELNLRKKYNINILGFRINGKLNMSVKAENVVQKGTSMMVLGKPDDIQRCFHL